MQKVQSESFNIGYFLTLISQRRWCIILPFCLAMIVGIVLAIKLPKIYEASTLILVQPPGVPEKLVTPVVETHLYSRVNTLSQQILSRSNLERIIDRFRLFGDPASRGMLDEEKIENLRKQVKVEVSRGRGGIEPNSFSIAVQDKDPQTAMKVANGLAESFIEENIKLREDQAVGTTDFLESELNTMRKRLQEVEQALRDFREKHKGMLPDELEANLRIMDRLNSQLAQKEDSLRSARTSLVAIQTDAMARLSAKRAAEMGDEENNPRKLRERLSEMKLKYTDQHPDIIRLKASIERLESELASESKSKSDRSPSAGSASSVDAGDIGSMSIRQRIELSGTIQALEADISKLKQSIGVYQQRVEETSKYGQELANLQRDYENMRQSYNSLLNRKLEAEIAVNMEKKQKGEQFMIIDVARLPEKPTFPKMPKIFMMTVAAGLGVGAALIFLLEMMDASVRRLDRLEEDIGLPVLSMVPRIFTSKDLRRHRLVSVGTTVSIVVMLALAATFAMLVFRGVEPTLKMVGYYAGT